MTRDEFASLPPMIALGLIYDVASQRLKDLPMPHVPKPPLFDGRLGKGREGFVWMSEMLLRDLQWWEATKRRSAENGGEWAEKDLKTANTLAKWIEWRALFPSEIWSGKRGEERVTAAPPSREPKLQSWGTRAGKPAGNTKTRNQPAGPPDEEDEGYGF